MSRLIISGVLFLAVAIIGRPLHAQDAHEITIGTGGKTGVYYVVGQLICRFINLETKKSRLKCSAPATDGSIANLYAIARGELAFGIVQSDWQHHAFHGAAKFKGNANPKLRAVFSLHAEPFTVVARRQSGIQALDDLVGKRVNIGNPGSGQRGTMEVLMALKGWGPKTFAAALELPAAEQAKALLAGLTDAIVYTVGHPNQSIQQATADGKSIMIPVVGPNIDKLVASRPYYAWARVPARMYKGIDKEVPTFGVRSILITSNETPDEVVYQVVRSVLENIERIKKLHPALRELAEKEMARFAITIPMHRGAQRYFKEKKLL